MKTTMHNLLSRLADLSADSRPRAFMEVCGTHTVAAFRSGLHSLLPANVRLVSGPGCPVCVTSQGDIDVLIELARKPDVILATYGDMIRVPGSAGSLAEARAGGADVRIIYSTLDAVKLAADRPDKQVVLGAVGFETTTPPTAVAVLEAAKRGLKNFSVWASHKRVMPALEALLQSAGEDTGGTQGFLLPGHVSVILGIEVYRPIVEKYGMPCVIVGFEPLQIAAGIVRLMEMVQAGKPELNNLYGNVVTAKGNTVARAIIDRVFEPAAADWRGLGRMDESGLRLRAEYRAFDAAERFSVTPRAVPEPAGCRCGEVICGRMTPDHCRLFGKVCTPVNPIGPCMVSSEGTCGAWFRYSRQSAIRNPQSAIKGVA